MVTAADTNSSGNPRLAVHVMVFEFRSVIELLSHCRYLLGRTVLHVLSYIGYLHNYFRIVYESRCSILCLRLDVRRDAVVCGYFQGGTKIN